MLPVIELYLLLLQLQNAMHVLLTSMNDRETNALTSSLTLVCLEYVKKS